MTIEVVLKDRIKEISHSTGTGSFQLDGAATGYSAFSGIVPFNSTVFYCIRDNENYEVGSGQLLVSGSNSTISRFPYQSTNSNNRVNFAAGVKEVFVTYPGKYSVVSALPNDATPQRSGIPFWNNAHTLNYNSDLIFDDTNTRIGIRQIAPLYTLDLGGDNVQSTIRSSGMIIGDSGIMFSGVSATGGRQIEPFLRNVADNTTGFDSIVALSGDVSQGFTLEKQAPTAIFAGPLSSCGCVSDYPTFRLLTSGDIPDLSFHYANQYNTASNVGTVAVYKGSGTYQYDNYLRWDVTNNRLGVNKLSPVYTLDVDGTAGISGAVIIGGTLTVDGNLDVQGAVTYIDSTTVTILDKQLELGSMSGSPQYADAALNDAGLSVLSSSASGDKQWVWKESNNAWNTSDGIGIYASGLIRTSSGIIGERINITGNNSLNYFTGSCFFRTTTSDPFAIRINQNGIRPYTTSGVHYNGHKRYSWSESATHVMDVENGIDPGQLFIYSAGLNSGVEPTTYDNYQRLAVSGHRYGNFEITTQALGSGNLRAIDFKADTIFTSGTTFNSTVVTQVSGTNTIVDASGFLVIPTYTSVALATGAIPVAQDGAIALGGTSLLISNGTNWYSGVLGLVS